MKNNLFKLLSLLTISSALVSCSFYISIDFPESSEKSRISTSYIYTTSEESLTSYETPSGAYIAENLTEEISYSVLNQSCGITALPSSGTVNMLVFPIEFKDHKFSTYFRGDLERCMNGNGYEDTGYWESLSSFYKKSSYGKLNIVCTIADTYEVGMTPAKFLSTYTEEANKIGEDAGGYCASKAAELAVNEYISKGNSTSKFDNDGDGYIDGLILIYSCHNTVEHSITDGMFSKVDPEGNLFWAFSYYTNLDPNTQSPTPYNYLWASYDFMYAGCEDNQVDAHTYIHETGHILGLDDYYGNYDLNPTGGLCMMDCNILDHDPFSKTALGWTNPYVVTDSCSITLNPFSSTGDCVILPVTKSGSLSFNDTPFDEYIIIDLYTPTGLNYLDSHTKYTGSPQGFTNNGIRIWHVDARILEEYYNGRKTGYWSGDSLKIGQAWYYVGASNAYKVNDVDDDFQLLTLIDKSHRIFTTDSALDAYADDNSLFRAGDSFTFNSYSSAFPKTTKMNNGSSFDWKIDVVSTNNNHAVVNISRS